MTNATHAISSDLLADEPVPFLVVTRFWALGQSFMIFTHDGSLCDLLRDRYPQSTWQVAALSLILAWLVSLPGDFWRTWRRFGSPMR
jgi:hypothetical protein